MKRRGPRGRPREYDPEVALQQAMDAFWDTGFSGTSLDDLSTRTGMNRPSLYAAFGDKQALYLKTLEAYLAGRRKDVAAALAAGRPLRETLRELYETVLDRFLEGDRGARGCYLVGTAATEAVDNPEVREALARSLRELDGGFREAFSRAKARGELGPEADPEALARSRLRSCIRSPFARGQVSRARPCGRWPIQPCRLICSSGGPTRKRGAALMHAQQRPLSTWTCGSALGAIRLVVRDHVALGASDLRKTTRSGWRRPTALVFRQLVGGAPAGLDGRNVKPK